MKPPMSRASRVPFTIVATFALILTLDSSRSDPAVPDPPPPAPDLAEAGDLQALASWVAGTDRGAGLQALRPADLGPAIGAPRRRFELFPHDPRDPEQRALLEALPFGGAMLAAAERNRLDALLLAAIVEAESRFAPDAVSPKGAVGLMQLLPSTAESYGATDLFDPHVNLDVGSRYLGALIERYSGDLELALAAYNAGPAAVARYGGVPPYRETRAYVKRVISRYVDHHQAAQRSGVEAAAGPAAPRARS